MAANEELAMLVQPDRVHRSVYSDPALFELEMERIFGRAWLLLGHVSQVPRPGDYFTTRMGREPVVVINQDARIAAPWFAPKGAATWSASSALTTAGAMTGTAR